MENFIDKYANSTIIDDNGDTKKKIKLIIKNTFQDINANITYFYYLRYINQKDKIENEDLNTIAPIYSNMQYFDEIKTEDINKELLYEIESEIEQSYSSSLLIKFVNESENDKDEKYYSIPLLDFNTNKTFYEKNKILIIIIIFSFSLIIIFLIFFLCWRKIKKRNTNLEDKFKAITFSSGIEEDSSNINVSNKSKVNDEYENTFI